MSDCVLRLVLVLCPSIPNVGTASARSPVLRQQASGSEIRALLEPSGWGEEQGACSSAGDQGCRPGNDGAGLCRALPDFTDVAPSCLQN